MIGTRSNTCATVALLSFYPIINPSTAFIITPSPLTPIHHHPIPTTTTTTTNHQNLHKLFASNPINDEDDAGASSSPKTISQSQAVLDEAQDALQSVGWSSPMNAGELSSDDPFVQRIEAQIWEESGVGLEELLNPAKVRLLCCVCVCVCWCGKDDGLY